jgi:glycosyltransferase involved in cell wall biosynthesis
MSKYKILSVTPFFPPDIGGISNHVMNLNSNLVLEGHSVSMMTPKRLGAKIPLDAGSFKQMLRINSVFLPGWPYPTLRSVSIPLDLGHRIDATIKDENFDVIHVHGHHYPISWMVLKSAHKHGIPCILTLHGMYALNPNVLGGKSWIEDCFNKYIFKNLLLKSNAVIGLTDHITNYAKKFGGNAIKYFTIPNGVNTTIYTQNRMKKNEYRKKFHIPENKIVILFSGRFEKVKGIIEFAQAAKNIVQNNNVEVVIVGAGSLESQLKSTIGKTDGIHLLHWLPMDQIHELYIASDIFIIPSRFEALPIAVIEAMNAGLHIVYTPVGGIPDILKGYSLKTVLQNISIDEIQKTLKLLVSNFSVGDSSDSMIYAQKFDWKNISHETIKVYSEFIHSTTQ